LFSNEQAMNETAVYSCKISATIADPDGETPVTVGDSRLGIKEGHAGGTWPSPRATALFVGLGGARSPRESSVMLPGGGLPGLRCAFGDPISIFVYQTSDRDRSGDRIVELIWPLFCAATRQ
jgi:hypothetical protein